MGKTDTVLCYLCKTDTKSIHHLYWECPINKRLWERLKLFIFENTGLNIALDPLLFLMGIDRARPKENPLELFILLSLIVKNYIHSSKCNNKLPTQAGLVQSINSLKGIALSIATKKGKRALNNHLRKWLWME